MTEEQKILFEELQQKRRSQVEAFDFSMEGIKRGTEDIYPETAHFVYELLQNADDCKATEVIFYLQKERLIFKHNGSVHFNISHDTKDAKPYGHINSITAYRSTKTEGDVIGKFGIGFKSVYQYTDKPEIYDDVFKFYIAERMIPNLIDHDHPLRETGETLFSIDFKNPNKDFKEIKDRLENLKDPVLFLPNIKIIKWNIEGKSGEYYYCKEEKSLGKFGNDSGYFVTLKDKHKTEKLFLFVRKVKVRNKTFPIKVGYYLDENNKLNLSCRPNIYCFFPTEEKYNMCFVAHAPFLLTNSRTSRKQCDVNSSFDKGISSLASDSLVYLKEIGLKNNDLLIDDNLFEILRAENVNQELHNSFVEVVTENALLLSRNKRYIFVKDAFRGDSEDIETLLSIKQLNALFQNENNEYDFVFNKKDHRNIISQSIIEEIGLNSFDTKSFIEHLTPDFLKNQEPVWIDRLYNYFEGHARQYWSNSYSDSNRKKELLLKICQFIITDNGEWLAPFDSLEAKISKVFLPPKNMAALKGNCYRFVDSNYYERHKSFFDGMGLHEPNVVDYVKLDFLPKYENEEIDDVEVLSDFDQLYKIWRNSGDEQKESLREELSGRYKIKTVNNELCICNMVFEDNDVTRGFYGEKKDFRFVDCCFYERSNLHLEIEKINSFFCEIGIQRGLIIKAKYDNDVPKHIKNGFASSGIIAKSSLPYTSIL